MPAALPFPRVSFLLAEGLRVWGVIDGGEIKLEAGTKPNSVEFRMPKHEYSQLANSLGTTGDLELWLSSDDRPDVVLVGWDIWWVRDSMRGTIIGETAASVIEKVYTLMDRRWEFLDGRGGHAFYGRINAPSADGNTLLNPTPYPLPVEPVGREDHVATFHACIGSLMMRLQYSSGLAPASRDIIFPHLVEIATPIPQDLKWDGVHAMTEIGKLCDAAGFAWVLQTNGTYDCRAIGTGDLPTLEDRIVNDTANVRSTRPATVVITSAPTRLLVQGAAKGIGDDGWQYVAPDTDGTFKKLADLSYVTATGKTPQALMREDFASCDEAGKVLGRRTMFQYIQLAAAASHGAVPMLTRLAETGKNVGDVDMELPIRIKARFAMQNYGLWNTTDELWEMGGWQVTNPGLGIICFRVALGKVDIGNATDFYEHFTALAAGDLEVTYLCESQHAVHPDSPAHADYFNRAYQMDSGGNLVEADIDAALSPEAKDVKIVRAPELQGYVDQYGNLTNSDLLGQQAMDMARAALGAAGPTETRIYKGFHDVSPNGKVAAVRWNVAACTTSFDVNAYAISRCRYVEKQAAAGVAAKADAGATAAVAAPAQQVLGGRDYAGLPRHNIGSALAEQQPGLAVRWGKATATWADDCGNVIYLHPCDIDGSNEDTAKTITTYIFLPADTTPAYARIASGDVLAYLPIAANPATHDPQGLLVNVNPLPAKGATYSLLGVSSDGPLSFDWGRMHS